VLLVLDGLGVGAMDDADPSDRGSHTLRSVHQHAGPLRLPNLLALGLGAVAGVDGLDGAGNVPRAAHGRSELAHPGADTYLGHQELMGASLERIRLGLMDELGMQIEDALRARGHRVRPFVPGRSALLVDATVVVVVVSGPGFGVEEMRANLRELPTGQVGVDCVGLGVYDEHYRVRHLGADFDVGAQLPARALAHGRRIALIGKAADVIRCEGAVRDPLVPTEDVLARLVAALESDEAELIVANVQEADLSGHEQDPDRFAVVLHQVDAFLPRVLALLGTADVLVICADHGNDPAIGHGQHTRERTPLLVAGDRIAPIGLGTRATLADVGATLAELLGVGTVATGASFAREVIGVP
jgi:phosphopentomutase